MEEKSIIEALKQATKNTESDLGLETIYLVERCLQNQLVIMRALSKILENTTLTPNK